MKTKKIKVYVCGEKYILANDCVDMYSKSLKETLPDSNTVKIVKKRFPKENITVHIEFFNDRTACYRTYHDFKGPTFTGPVLVEEFTEEQIKTYKALYE